LLKTKVQEDFFLGFLLVLEPLLHPTITYPTNVVIKQVFRLQTISIQILYSLNLSTDQISTDCRKLHRVTSRNEQKALRIDDSSRVAFQVKSN